MRSKPLDANTVLSDIKLGERTLSRKFIMRQRLLRARNVGFKEKLGKVTKLWT